MKWMKGLGVMAVAGLAAAPWARAEAQQGPAPAPAAAAAPEAVPKGGVKQFFQGQNQNPGATNRESVITAKKIEFDNKEGVILFDQDVQVDDAQFVLRSDRLLVFMEGTNDLQQIMAIGNVTITNANRSASCQKAVFTKKDGRIVMTENARLKQEGAEAGEVGPAERIVIWLDDSRMEVSPGRVVLPPGTFNKGERKLMP